MDAPVPESAINLYHAALADFKENRSVEAEEKLRKVMNEFPEFEDAKEALAVLLFNLKRYEESLDVILSWVRANPDSVLAQTNLSRCYLALGKILEAEKAQAESRRLSWKAELKAKKMEMPKVDFSAQIERYRQVIAYDPQDVLGYFSLGNTYLQAGHYRDAADIFDQAIRVNAAHSASYLGYGEALQELGDRDKARKIYTLGIQAAQANGDMMTQKKMEARLRQIETSRQD